jgi:D-glycero-alpha-D-manno-heptose-7-phosphate kinase
MPDVITSSAPVRIDFGGSTLDLTPLVPLFPENVVTNLALSLRAEVRCCVRKQGISIHDTDNKQGIECDGIKSLAAEKKFILFYETMKTLGIDNGIGIEYKTGSPFGAGLGGSSALLIALLSGLQMFKDGSNLGDLDLIEEAAVIEKRIIGGPTGKQDYVSAVKGGLNAIRFSSDRIEIEMLPLDKQEFSSRLCVLFTGRAHFSGDNNFSVVNKALSGDIKTLSGLEQLKESSKAVYVSLKSMDFPSLIFSLNEEMKIRKDFFPSFTTNLIESLAAKAQSMGGALKVCGAGGGGSVFAFFCDSVPAEFLDEARKIGAEPLDCQPDVEGLKTSWKV